MTQLPMPFISRVRLRNYKSIAACDVALEPLTLFVGPNGTGKSNFLQALAFMSRALSTTPQEAIAGLGGMHEILRRAPTPADSLSIEIEARLPRGSSRSSLVNYGFEIGLTRRESLSSFETLRESCTFGERSRGGRFFVSSGRVTDHLSRQTKRIDSNRLYLPIASAGDSRIYRELHRSLTAMQFYNLSLDALREPTPAADRPILDPRGGQLANAIGALSALRPQAKERIDSYLSAISPGIKSLDRVALSGYVNLVFHAQLGSGREEIEFGANAVSDGTLRAAGVLTALFQLAAVDGRVPLIGLEEPELALHPAAAGVLFDALTEASERTQVIVTTQSPDLLDRSDLDINAVRAVGMSDGITTIGTVDSANREILSESLYTVGDLMRRDQLSPEIRSEDSRPEPARDGPLTRSGAGFRPSAPVSR